MKNYKDVIKVKNIGCFTKIGVADNEREIGQNLIIDLEVYLDLKKAGSSDELKDTISYVELSKLVQTVSQEGDFHLLEFFATKIIKEVFKQHKQALALGVLIKKPHIPAPEFKGTSEVFIFRERGDI